MEKSDKSWQRIGKNEFVESHQPFLDDFTKRNVDRLFYAGRNGLNYRSTKFQFSAIQWYKIKYLWNPMFDDDKKRKTCGFLWLHGQSNWQYSNHRVSMCHRCFSYNEPKKNRFFFYRFGLELSGKIHNRPFYYVNDLFEITQIFSIFLLSFLFFLSGISPLFFVGGNSRHSFNRIN